MRFFQEKNIQNAIKTSQFSVGHFKQKEPHIHVISDLAVQELKRLKHYYDNVLANENITLIVLALVTFIWDNNNFLVLLVEETT